VPGKLPYFSGTVRYESALTPHAAWAAAGRAELDLGDVYETAEVWINGIHAGVCICPPYRFNITAMLREGPNLITVEVTNTLAKKLGNNCFDRAVPQEPTGLIGPIVLRLLGALKGGKDR
jgi:hypothetical protein